MADTDDIAAAAMAEGNIAPQQAAREERDPPHDPQTKGQGLSQNGVLKP